MTINIDTVKVGDKVVAKDETIRRGGTEANDALEAGVVYTIVGVHKMGNGGTVSLSEKVNSRSPSNWYPGSFGYLLFKKAPEPVTLEGASDLELIEALQARGYKGDLRHEVTTTETVTL